MLSMAFDALFMGGLLASVVFLALLVWLMIRAGSDPKWAQISQGVRDERSRREREHGR
ncbi:Uncharacterised protein [uncultured archaeon]|nr:Uncharacterised protein [uncultured archaeon]